MIPTRTSSLVFDPLLTVSSRSIREEPQLAFLIDISRPVDSDAESTLLWNSCGLNGASVRPSTTASAYWLNLSASESFVTRNRLSIVHSAVPSLVICIRIICRVSGCSNGCVATDGDGTVCDCSSAGEGVGDADGDRSTAVGADTGVVWRPPPASLRRGGP